MEPISLTLAILPLIGCSISAYQATRLRLKIFCHHSRAVNRSRKLFERQRDVFLNETEIFLGNILKDKVLAKRMVAAENQSQWDDADLDEKIRKHMGRSTESLYGVLEEIKFTMEQLHEQLNSFSGLEAERLENESIIDAVKRLRQRRRIAFGQQKFSDLTGQLRRLNEDFGRLCTQSYKLNADVEQVAGKSCSHQNGVDRQFLSFDLIKKASRSLHKTLLEFWSNIVTRQIRHSLRLFLDAENIDGVRMNVGIFCYGHQMSHEVDVTQASLMRLEVRSHTLESMSLASHTGLPTPTNSSISSGSGSPENDDSQKHRKVRFALPPPDPQDDIEERLMRSSLYLFPFSERPIVSAKDVIGNSSDSCVELQLQTLRISTAQKQSCVPPDSPPLDHRDCCLEGNLRNSLCQNGFDSYISQSDIGPTEMVRMDAVLDQPIYTQLSVPHQFRMARQITAAVLKFNSTPWLSSYWSTKDLYLLHRNEGHNLSASLQTLHFRVDIVSDREWKDLNVNPPKDVEMPIFSDSIEGFIDEATRSHGIRNMTLYSLGVVLLAIGRWAHIDMGDIAGVRRLAAQPCYLGSKYQELTQRVLDCDFGFGKDLAEPRLQQAVYENVVLELDSMVERLELK